MKILFPIIITLLCCCIYGQVDTTKSVHKHGLVWTKDLYKNSQGDLIKFEKHRRLITRRHGTLKMSNRLIIIKEYNDNKKVNKIVRLEITDGCVFRKEEAKDYKHRFPAICFKRISNFLGLIFIPVDVWWMYKDDSK
jgi:hypothetical protein